MSGDWAGWGHVKFQRGPRNARGLVQRRISRGNSMPVSYREGAALPSRRGVFNGVYRFSGLGLACILLSAVSAASAAQTTDTSASYTAAIEKLASVEDGDPYAVDRLKYIVTKIRRGDRRCADQSCLRARELEVLGITEAILAADPSDPYWRDLKLCETAACAQGLVAPQSSANEPPTPQHQDDQQAEAPALEPADTTTTEEAISATGETAAPLALDIPQDAPGAQTAETPNAAVEQPQDSSLGWVLIATGVVFVGWLFWFFARRKCPSCKRRGTSVRTHREFAGESAGQRLKDMESRTTHRNKNSSGYMENTGESVTRYKVPVSTLTTHYVDDYRCRRCGCEYSVDAAETRDA